MVDVSSIQAGAAQGIDVISQITLWILMMGVLLFGLWFWKLYNSYNITVVIKRPLGNDGGFELDTGYRGKYFFNQDKEMRFKIWRANHFKIQYDEEPIDQRFVVPALSQGKRKKMIFFQPNDENHLKPLLLTNKDKEVIQVELLNSDITYSMTEIQKYANRYMEKSPFERYGMLVFLIFTVVVAGMFWYSARSNAKAMDAMASNYAQVVGTNDAIITLLQSINITQSETKNPAIVPGDYLVKVA
jgi:hypothetical protein